MVNKNKVLETVVLATGVLAFTASILGLFQMLSKNTGTSISSLETMMAADTTQIAYRQETQSMLLTEVYSTLPASSYLATKESQMSSSETITPMLEAYASVQRTVQAHEHRILAVEDAIGNDSQGALTHLRLESEIAHLNDRYEILSERITQINSLLAWSIPVNISLAIGLLTLVGAFVLSNRKPKVEDNRSHREEDLRRREENLRRREESLRRHDSPPE